MRNERAENPRVLELFEDSKVALSAHAILNGLRTLGISEGLNYATHLTNSPLFRVRMADDDPQMVAIAGREQNRGEQNHGQDDIDYIYVPRDVVAGLVVLSRTTEMSYFVHNLENLVYEGDPEIREFLRDRHDHGKIDFIEWCLFEHYDVEVTQARKCVERHETPSGSTRTQK
ncbi:hypothetical protein OSTOST_19179 [Ostertagia ostertagi]